MARGPRAVLCGSHTADKNRAKIQNPPKNLDCYIVGTVLVCDYSIYFTLLAECLGCMSCARPDVCCDTTDGRAVGYDLQNMVKHIDTPCVRPYSRLGSAHSAVGGVCLHSPGK